MRASILWYNLALSTMLGSAAIAQSRADTVRFINPPTLSTPRGYSHVAEVPAGTRLVYIAGQVALDSAGQLIGPGDLRAQATAVFENLRRALAAAGATFNDVVKLNYYVIDASQIAVLREVRDRYVNRATPPASTLVEVRRLFRDDVLLEVEAVAAVRRP
jgi:2-iminobutanoate/2-iminopropanoate deaminase